MKTEGNPAGQPNPLISLRQDRETVNKEKEKSMSKEMVNMDTGEILPAIPHANSPEATLMQAKAAASALATVVGAKKNPVRFKGEQYLEFEDWQTVARFYSLAAEVEWSRYIEMGTVHGFEARAVVKNLVTGEQVSAAESMCMNDEDRWSQRPKYKEVNGKRVQDGSEAVPLFQLRSMAQTRACAKALRNVLSWVVVLAGYRGTPAEEMIDTTATTATQATNGNGHGEVPTSRDIFSLAASLPAFQTKGADGTITLDEYGKPKIAFAALGKFFKEKGVTSGTVKDMKPEEAVKAMAELTKLATKPAAKVEPKAKVEASRELETFFPEEA